MTDRLSQLLGPPVGLETLNWPVGISDDQVGSLREKPRVEGKSVRDVVLYQMWWESLGFYTAARQMNDIRLNLVVSAHRLFIDNLWRASRCVNEQSLRRVLVEQNNQSEIMAKEGGYKLNGSDVYQTPKELLPYFDEDPTGFSAADRLVELNMYDPSTLDWVDKGNFKAVERYKELYQILVEAGFVEEL